MTSVMGLHTQSHCGIIERGEREGEFDDVCAGLIVQKIDFAYGSGHYDSYFDKQFQ
jgi:hypothetical protein